MRILIINGPNLNLTGKRQQDVYGSVSFEEILADLRALHPEVTIDYLQSNLEGEIIEGIQEANGKYAGVILNAGGYTHTSVAIGDAVATVDLPVIEVHMSNVDRREPFRKISHIASQCVGSIAGFGAASYFLAVEALKRRSEKYFFRNK